MLTKRYENVDAEEHQPLLSVDIGIGRAIFKFVI